MSAEIRSGSEPKASQPRERAKGAFVAGLEKNSAGLRLFEPHTISPPKDSIVSDTGYSQVADIPAYYQVTNSDTMQKPYFIGVYADRGTNPNRIATMASVHASGETLEKAEEQLREKLVAGARGEGLSTSTILRRRTEAVYEAARDAFRPVVEHSVTQLYPAQIDSEQAA